MTGDDNGARRCWPRSSERGRRRVSGGTRASDAIRYGVVLAAAVVVSACAARTGQVPPMPAPPHVAARGPSVERIRHTRLLRVAADLSYPPMAYRQNGTPAGFDVELATLLAESLGARLRVIDTPIAVLKGAGIPSDADAAAGALGPGLIPGAVSTPYYVSSQAILSPARAAITAAGQLRGLRVAVPAAGGALDVARSAGANVEVTDLPAQALAAVATGRAQAAVTDAPLALDFAAAHPGLHVTAGVGERVPFVIDVPATAPDLAAFVAAALRELDRDGGLATLRARWHL